MNKTKDYRELYRWDRILEVTRKHVYHGRSANLLDIDKILFDNPNMCRRSRYQNRYLHDFDPTIKKVAKDLLYLILTHAFSKLCSLES